MTDQTLRELLSGDRSRGVNLDLAIVENEPEECSWSGEIEKQIGLQSLTGDELCLRTALAVESFPQASCGLSCCSPCPALGQKQ